MITSRSFLRGAVILLTVGALSVHARLALAQQMSDKPEVKLSELRPVVRKYVEKMSETSKKLGWGEFSSAQQIEMVDALISNMKARGNYNFVDR